MSVVSVQLRTTEANELIISRTRFFGENMTTDMKPDGQKELKKGVFVLFPRLLARQISEQNFGLYHVPNLYQPQQPGPQIHQDVDQKFPRWCGERVARV